MCSKWNMELNFLNRMLKKKAKTKTHTPKIKKNQPGFFDPRHADCYTTIFTTKQHPLLKLKLRELAVSKGFSGNPNYGFFQVVLFNTTTVCVYTLYVEMLVFHQKFSGCLLILLRTSLNQEDKIMTNCYSNRN